MTAPEMLTMSEAAEELRKSFSTIRNYVRNGDLHSVHIDVSPLIPRSEVERLKAEGLLLTFRCKPARV